MSNIVAIPLVVLAIINIVFGSLVFMGSRRTRQAGLFMVFDIAVGLWSLGIGLLYLTTLPEAALWFVRLYYFAAALIAYALLLFILDYVGKRLSRFQSWLVLLPFLAVVLTILSSNGLIGAIELGGKPYVMLNKPVYVWYTIYFIAYFVSSVAVAWQACLRKPAASTKTIDKKGMRYVLTSILISGVFGMFFNLFLPLFGNYDLVWVGPIGSIVMVMLIFIAVIRHSLFDIKMAIFFAFGYLLLGLGLFGIASVVMLLLNGLMSGDWTVSFSQYIVTLISAGLMIASYGTLKKLVEKITEGIFFKRTYDTQIELKRFNSIVVSEIELVKILEKTRKLLVRIMDPETLTIVALNQDLKPVIGIGPKVNHENYTSDLEKAYRQPDIYINKNKGKQERLVVYLRASSQVVGYMVFGPKKSGGLYREKDTHLIQTVAAELSVAIQNGLRYEEIKDFNETLRDKVEEATVELRATNRRLKQVDQAKDEFISLTSHQLRTPLTTIKGYISMLLDGDAGEVTPAQRKLLREAFNSSQRMVHLIGDFLNMSRIQTGKFEIELTDVNLAEILDEEIEQLLISAKSRQITLAYDKPAHFPVLPCDDGKIRQVMMNFIDNAIYYSPPGSTITIVLSSTNTTVEFKVIDEGIGVPRAEQHRLFSKFSRASNAKKQRPDGTGIGLFMAKKVIVALGGAIIFKSQENKGSTFGFRLNRPKTAP